MSDYQPPQPHGANGPQLDGDQQPQSGDDQDPRSTEEDIQQLRRIQTLIAVSFIAGPVSLLIGGVLLSTISFVCSILAFRRIRRLDGSVPEDARGLVASMRTQSTVALVINVLAMCVNLVAFVLSAATLMGLMQSGQLDQLMQDYGLSGSGSEAIEPDKSIWDRAS